MQPLELAPPALRQKRAPPQLVYQPRPRVSTSPPRRLGAPAHLAAGSFTRLGSRAHPRSPQLSHAPVRSRSAVQRSARPGTSIGAATAAADDGWWSNPTFADGKTFDIEEQNPPRAAARRLDSAPADRPPEAHWAAQGDEERGGRSGGGSTERGASGVDAGELLSTIKKAQVAWSENPSNFHQAAAVYILGSGDEGETAATQPSLRIQLTFAVLSFGMVFVQAMVVSTIVLSTGAPVCLSNSDCQRAGTFCAPPDGWVVGHASCAIPGPQCSEGHTVFNTNLFNGGGRCHYCGDAASWGLPPNSTAYLLSAQSIWYRYI